ncbi:cobalamin B12-binding domain-containing protein [Alkalicaulis satelles]|uniref:Cobalamin B12-binding domain-containing protein n=1 Tax=Alkalicaulis satelles TaxID=2609175 RepID=A0A5M6ZP78_9PROT|nr:cobalamin-dependent protein [Alkalicaulis satelles]KAA5804021.1 cobalamin B12-binding domain-containing protein [Alkalicaulis satelles]
MAQTEFDPFKLAGLAKQRHAPFAWKLWGLGPKPGPCQLDKAGPPKDVLDKLIEAEIIPRLMLINREAAAALDTPPRPFPPAPFSPSQIEQFARRAVDSDACVLVDDIDALIQDGFSHEDILLKLLTPAARHLGWLWEEDLVDFTDVTIGLMKLHRVLDGLRADTPGSLGSGKASPRILLAPSPGEQHVFGVVMVGEFFARSGWRVHCESAPEAGYLTEAVAQTRYDVVGLSASCAVKVKPLRELIRQLRAQSRNPDLIVLVGGPAFNGDMEMARRIGADATATDGVRAVVTAERLVHRLTAAV